MTSVDSGIETSNNSDDSSIAQNEDASTDEISNGSSALATINSNQFEYHDIKPLDIKVPFLPWSGMDMPFTISPLGSVNENYTYPHEVDSSIATSSSGFVPAQGLSIKSHQSIHRPARLTPAYFYSYMRVKSIRKTQNLQPILRDNAYNRFVERRMRIAAATNNTMMMKRLLSQGVSPNNCDFLGRTPLHLACCRGYTEMVGLLLQYGADPNLRDSLGNTPLHFAAVTSKSVVTLLLNAGVDPACLDQDEYNPLQLVRTKLHMLQSLTSQDSTAIKEEVQNIVSMLLAYLQKHKDTHRNVEALTTFCSRLSLSNTSEQVQIDVKDLLVHLDALSITQ